jgi:hypothetical protein
MLTFQLGQGIIPNPKQEVDLNHKRYRRSEFAGLPFANGKLSPVIADVVSMLETAPAER